MMIEGLEVMVRCSREEPESVAAILACDLGPEQLRRLAAALEAAAARREGSARSTQSIRLRTQRYQLLPAE